MPTTTQAGEAKQTHKRKAWGEDAAPEAPICRSAPCNAGKDAGTGTAPLTLMLSDTPPFWLKVSRAADPTVSTSVAAGRGIAASWSAGAGGS